MFADDYLGRAWVAGEYDCWSFVCDVYTDHLNVDLPAVTVNTNNLAAVIKVVNHHPFLVNFKEIEKPEDFCLVFMSTYGKSFNHIGIFVDGRVLHNSENIGVVSDDLFSINRLFKKVVFKKYV